MAYTLQQYNDLQEAYSQGILSFRDANGRAVQYQTRSEMKRILEEMASELGLTRQSRRRIAALQYGRD